MKSRLTTIISALLILCGAARAADGKPNIIFFLFDDMGWGQPQSYNPASALRTPNLDKLASLGMRFTDAHTGAAVCTPTRYGVLTGRYPRVLGSSARWERGRRRSFQPHGRPWPPS